MSAAHNPRVLLLGIGNLLWADEGFGVRCIEAMALRYRFGPNVTMLDGGTQGLYLVDQVRSADVLVVFDAVDYGLPPGTLQQVEGDEVPKFLGAKKMSLHQTGFQEVLALADLLGDAPSRLLLIGVQPVELEDFGGSLRPEVKAALYPAIDLALTYLAALGVRPLDESGAALASAPLTAGSASAFLTGAGGDPSPTADSAVASTADPATASDLAVGSFPCSATAAGTGATSTGDSASAPVPAAWSSVGQDMRQDLPHPALDLAAYELGRPPPELACRNGDERVLAKRAKPVADGALRRSVSESAQPNVVDSTGPNAADSAQLSATTTECLGAGRRTGPNVSASVSSKAGWTTAPQT